MSWAFTLPLARPEMSANEQRRWHWARQRQAKKTVQDLTWVMAKKAKLPPMNVPVEVTITWYPRDRRTRDSDSLGPTMKAVLDGLVAAGVLVDDSDRHVPRTSNAIGAVDSHHPRIEVRIDPVVTG